MKPEILEVLARTCGLDPSPRPIAQTIEDFPVPLGPMIKFNPGDGLIVIFSNVMKFRSLIHWIEPGANLFSTSSNISGGAL